MQTFLPYPSFIESAKCLDYRRLGKQRVECKQILTALSGGTAWKNHPAVLMWKDHIAALQVYANVIIKEWIDRGYKNNMPYYSPDIFKIECPPWFGIPEFHASHRSNLLRKDPEYYGQFGWTEPDNLEYYWPTKQLSN